MEGGGEQGESREKWRKMTIIVVRRRCDCSSPVMDLTLKPVGPAQRTAW